MTFKKIWHYFFHWKSFTFEKLGSIFLFIVIYLFILFILHICIFFFFWFRYMYQLLILFNVSSVFQIAVEISKVFPKQLILKNCPDVFQMETMILYNVHRTSVFVWIFVLLMTNSWMLKTYRSYYAVRYVFFNP